MFSAWLKQRRKALDLRQEDLAEMVGCALVTIQKIETGERRPSKQIAALLAACLGIPDDERAAFVRFARSAGDTTSLPHPPASTAPWRTLERRRTNLPAAPAPLVGRREEVKRVGALLLRDGVRLVTLRGAPGIGKTSLAIAVARELLEHFDDGVVFVALAPLADSALVAHAVAETLGVTEQGGRSIVDSLRSFVGDKRMLLVIDNFEHVLAAAPLVAELLAASPWLKVLVTSREALNLRGERQVQVTPLALPDLGALPPAEELEAYSAIALFLDCARSVAPEFRIGEQDARPIAEICARLDGLPLAIELVAARTRILPPQALLARIERRLALATDGAQDFPARQRTLRHAIGWSFDLLTAEQQILFRRLGVFAAGCTLAALAAVCRTEAGTPEGVELAVLGGIEALIDKNLVDRMGTTGDGEARFAMLETIREFAQEELAASGEAALIRRLHAEYYLALVEAAEPELRGPAQIAWLRRLDQEQGNLRAALSWLAAAGEVDAGMRLAGALAWYWELRGFFTEGEGRLAALLSQAVADETAKVAPLAHAKALNAAGRLASRQGHSAHARQLLEHSLAISRKLGNQCLMLLTLHNLGNVAMMEGNPTAARRYHEESLRIGEAAGDTWGSAWAHMGLGHVAFADHHYAAAQHHFERSLLLRRAQEDRWGIARSLNELGDVASAQGELAVAGARYAESLTIHRELQHMGFLANVLRNLAVVVLRQGNHTAAAEMLRESIMLFREQGRTSAVVGCLVEAAKVAGAAGRLAEAVELWAAVEAHERGLSASERADLEQARSYLQARLGASRFMEAWTKGGALTFDQAVGGALRVSELD